MACRRRVVVSPGTARSLAPGRSTAGCSGIKMTTVPHSPINLGNGVVIRHPVFLAPMAGVSDAVFRQLCREAGAGYATTEFSRDEALLRGIQAQVDLIDLSLDARPAGVQIFGSDPDTMRRAAAFVMSHASPDILDINMGCPAPKVTAGQGGSSLLRDPDRAIAIVRGIAEEIAPTPTTVKIRVGWDDAHKQSGVAVSLAKQLVDAGARMITVHGRTRQQRYEGLACWDTIAAVAAAVSVPVIGNGDIQTPADVMHRLRTSGVSGVAIGRAARGRPWIFGQIAAAMAGQPLPPDPDTATRIALGLDHISRQIAYEAACVARDPSHARRAETTIHGLASGRALGHLLPHVMWYVWGTPGANEARRALSRARSAEELHDVLADFGARPDAYRHREEDRALGTVRPSGNEAVHHSASQHEIAPAGL